jgi:hypothetical protein
VAQRFQRCDKGWKIKTASAAKARVVGHSLRQAQGRLSPTLLILILILLFRFLVPKHRHQK